MSFLENNPVDDEWKLNQLSQVSSAQKVPTNQQKDLLSQGLSSFMLFHVLSFSFSVFFKMGTVTSMCSKDCFNDIAPCKLSEKKVELCEEVRNF